MAYSCRRILRSFVYIWPTELFRHIPIVVRREPVVALASFDNIMDRSIAALGFLFLGTSFAFVTAKIRF